MAVTQNTYTGNGSTTNYSFTFPYLETTDIKVSLNGTVTTAYTLANATTIQFNTAPANGAAIRIYRQTDDAALAATFYPGSAIRSQDLNENFTQNLYVTQESTNNAATATTTANTALTNSNTAISTANSAVSTANTASSNASAAVATANTASSNASAAVSTANTASSNATTAVNTANAATATANSATSTANTALSTANAATSTANAASAAATNAVNTANAASSAASSAVSTANTASTNASNAVTTANTASSNATTAVNTANSAVATANSAAAAVANAVIYTIVANVAAIPASPSNNTAIEVANSTGIESFTPLAGKPGGFVGNSGLSVRILYSTAGSTWNWVQYFPNDPETRYLKLGGGTLTGSLGVTTGSAASPSVFISGDTNTGIYSPGADQVAISTNSVGRLFVDASGNVGVGTNSTRGVGGAATGLLHVESASSARYTVIRNSDDAFGSVLALGKTRGTVTGSNTIVQNGDTCGQIYFAGADGLDVVTRCAQIAGEIDGVPGADNLPGRLVFSTTPSGSNVVSERLRITSAGLVGVGTSSPTALLTVQGTTLIRNTERLAFNTYESDTVHAGYIGRNTSTGALEIASQNIGANYPINLITANTSRLHITAAGLVGVGTSSPFTILHSAISIAGGNPATSGTTDANVIARFQGGSVGLDIGGTASGLQWIQPRSVNSFATNYGLAICPNGGNVGIGTASPQAVLHVERNFAGEIGYFANNPNAGGYSALRLGNSDRGTNGDHVVYGGNELGLIAKTGAPIAFFTAGSEKARIDSSGRLGIGTSAPDAKLEVVGTDLSASYQTLVSADSPTAAIVNQAANTYFRIAGGSYGNASSVNLDLASNQSKNKDIQGGWRISSITGTPASSATGSNLQIKPITYTSSNTITEGGASLTITNTGNVGIGTTSPGHDIDLRKDAPGSTVTLRVRNDNVAADSNSALVLDTPNGVWGLRALRSGARLAVDIGGSEKAAIDTSGRLLVGTSSARDAGGNFGGSTGKHIHVETTDIAVFTGVSNKTSGATALATLGAANGSSAGSVGIVGNGQELGRLQFVGADGVDLDSIAGSVSCFVDGTPGANDMPGRLVFSTTADGASSPTERMRINSEGVVHSLGYTDGAGVNAWRFRQGGSGVIADSMIETIVSATSARYHYAFRNGATSGNASGAIVGSISTSGSATTFATSSDYRLKENVTPVTDGITRLQQLKPTRFNFIVDPNTVVDGFIAHEVQDVVPEAITGEKDAVDADGNPVYQGIDQSKLVPLLTAALQEAIGEIESLKARVAALESA